MSSQPLNWFDNVEIRPHPWPGLNWLTAMLYVPDVKAAIEFYERAFHFVNIFSLPSSDGNFDFARMRYRGSNFTLNREKSYDFDGLSPESTQILPPLLFYVYVDDVDQAVDQAVRHGCELIQPVHLEVWGDRKGRIRDPFGYYWELATKVN